MQTWIQNCRIIDGSGAAAYRGSVGVGDDGKLTVLHGVSSQRLMAKEWIDGAGMTVTPGFIDAHSHGDLTLCSRYATMSKLSQGITTQFAGQCGVSLFPSNLHDRAGLMQFASGIATHPELPEDLRCCESAEPFIDWMNALHNPVHTRLFVGHGALRRTVMGYKKRKPDEIELQRMCQLLRNCLRGGAIGLSAGQVYAPSCYADNDELLALLRVVAEEGGFFACHPRNEADTCVEARRESIRLAATANVPLCLSHLKAAGRDNWGKPAQMLADVDRAVASGQKILIDCYPYMAGCTALNVSIPPQYFTHGLDGLVRALGSKTERDAMREQMSHPSGYDNYIYNSGGFSGVFVSSCPVDHSAEGMFLSDYAAQRGVDAFDAYCDLLIRNNGLGLGVYFHMSEDDVAGIFRHPLCAVGTDGLLGAANENPHPRAFGTMARAYDLMVRQKAFASPEQAINKMTGLTADWFGLASKGHVQDGFDADILVLDLDRFADHATYADGRAQCSGILRVYSGGTCVYQEGDAI